MKEQKDQSQNIEENIKEKILKINLEEFFSLEIVEGKLMLNQEGETPIGPFGTPSKLIFDKEENLKTSVPKIKKGLKETFAKLKYIENIKKEINNLEKSPKKEKILKRRLKKVISIISKENTFEKFKSEIEEEEEKERQHEMKQNQERNSINISKEKMKSLNPMSIVSGAKGVIKGKINMGLNSVSNKIPTSIKKSYTDIKGNVGESIKKSKNNVNNVKKAKNKLMDKLK